MFGETFNDLMWLWGMAVFGYVVIEVAEGRGWV